MWSDYATILLSCVTLLFSLINFLIGHIINSKESQYELWKNIEEVNKVKIEIKNLELEQRTITYFQKDNVETYLRKIVDIIKEIYPKSNPSVSIKVIYKDNAKDFLESQVITWYTYPVKKNNNNLSYKIKNNSDFKSILQDNREYFFVSDLKKYSALNDYSNENKDFLKEYNTSIVVPIKKKDKKRENIIGFLCLESQEKLGNVKKNKSIIELIEFAASNLYEFLSQNIMAS